MDPMVDEMEAQDASTGTYQSQQQRRFIARGGNENEDLGTISQAEGSRPSAARRIAANPFDDLCPAGSELITLRLTRKPREKEVVVSSEVKGPEEAMYTAKYSGPGNKIITILHHEEGVSESSRQMYKITMPQNDREGVEIEAAWVDESNASFNFLSKQRQEPWQSAVGTLEGHNLLWFDLENKASDNARTVTVIRCFDIDDNYREVCTVLSKSPIVSLIEIPVHLLRNQRALDEMIGVAFAAREQRRSWPPEIDPLSLVNNMRIGGAVVEQ
jgi:hypothetical protein